MVNRLTMKTIIASFLTIFLLTALFFSILPNLFQIEAMRRKFGLCAHVQSGDLDNETKRCLFLETGARWVRTDWTWNETRNDELINWTHSNGIKILGILDHQTMNFHQNFNLTDWVNTVYNAVRLYPEIDAWEIWNEPNIPPFNFGFMNGTPSNYVQMLSEAYRVIKKETNGLVIFGGVSTYHNGWQEWLQKCYSLGAANFCDYQGLHTYKNVIDNVHDIGIAGGITGKQIWITEIGCPSCPSPFSTKTQADYVKENFENIRAFCPLIFWYEFIDPPNGNDKENYFGLVWANMTKKPSFNTFLYFPSHELGETTYNQFFLITLVFLLTLASIIIILIKLLKNYQIW